MTSEQIPHLIACDCGNSSIKIAHVHGEEVTGLQTFRIGELGDLGKALAELWDTIPEPKKIAAASVNAPALKALEAAVAESIRQPVLAVGRDLPLPIDTALEKPQAIGTDRLCAAAAAFDRLGVPCVIADFGTAVTIDCVNAEGVFLGGAILPGLRTGARALNDLTAQLPEVELTQPDWVFGQNTREAIIGGLVFGARGALREIVEAYATDLGAWPTVIVTGGDAHLVCPHPGETGIVQAVVEDLAVRGVAMAYYRSLLRS